MIQDNHVTHRRTASHLLLVQVPMEVPNRFELLSLLIDSPINEDQEKLIFDKLTGLEKGERGGRRSVLRACMPWHHRKDSHHSRATISCSGPNGVMVPCSGGIRMLEKMSKPMDKAKIEATLQQACAGRLHYLTDAQRKSVRITHLWCA